MKIEPRVMNTISHSRSLLSRATHLFQKPKRYRPESVTRLLLVVFLTGICRCGELDSHTALLWRAAHRGSSISFEQSGVGVVWTANWISHTFPVTISQGFGLLNLLGSLLAGLLLYRSFEKTTVFREASRVVQWFGSAAFLALALYYLDPSIWFQRVACLPSAGIAALMLWLWDGRFKVKASHQMKAYIAVSFFLLAVALAFVRLDIALLICWSLVIASFTQIGRELSPSRYAPMFTPLATAVAIVTIRSHVLWAQISSARYAGISILRLTHRSVHLSVATSGITYLVPLFWTTLQIFRRRFAIEGPGVVIMLGSIVYFAFWLVFGGFDEVSLFLPIAMINLPLTAEMAIRKVQTFETHVA